MDSEDESTHHHELLKSLEQTFAHDIRKRKIGKAIRTEAAKEINAFNFTSGDGPSLTMEKVLESLEGGGKRDKTKKNSLKSTLITNVSESDIKTLTKPLEKPVSEKIKRTVLYDNIKKDVSKWNSVVYHNRAADQLIFPLSASKKMPRKTAKDAASEFVPETLLEEEMAKILHGEEFVKKKKAEVYGKESLKSDAETYVLGIQEALEKHQEMARLRILQSYEQVKAKRQGKIKSKKYHRLLRREKIRKQLKEFEQLQKTDPEAALIKLEELDKSRVQERMSLKHRNTSKWAKMQSARAKYDKEARIVLSEQLKISRELTKKVEMESSESEVDDTDFELPNLVKSSLTNPWIMDPSVKDNEKVHLYYTGYKKFWQEVNVRKEKERQRLVSIEKKSENVSKKEEEKVGEKLKLCENENVVCPNLENSEKLVVPTRRKKSVKKSTGIGQQKNYLEENEEVTLDVLDRILDAAETKIKVKATKRLESLKREDKIKRKKSERKVKIKKSKIFKGDADEVRDLIVDESEKNIEGLADSIHDSEKGGVDATDFISLRNEKRSSFAQKLRQSEKVIQPASKLIDPNNFLRIDKNPKFDMGALNKTELDTDNEVLAQAEDPEEERLKIIAEAFEDDELLEEFRRKKQEEVDLQTPKDVNLTLPGWGEWGGKNLKPNRRKQKRFTLSVPLPPRRDARISHVILNDDANSKLKEHQVRALPFPFKRVEDFEKVIRAPVGRTWLPEPAMKSLIAPKIITRLGAVIQPISEDVLVKKAELEAKKPQLTGLKVSPKVVSRKSVKNPREWT